MKKYAMPAVMLAVFETIAVTLWLTKDNMFYMFNDEAVHAVLRCERRVLDHMIDTFGKEAMITPCGEDRFDIHIKGSRSGILLFAQQYIDAVSIAEPEDLRKEMLERLKKAAETYKK